MRVILGRGDVIEGWEEGLLGMVQGEKRRLTIPPNKAYGQNSNHILVPQFGAHHI